MKKIYEEQPYTIYELCKDMKISNGLIYNYLSGKKQWDNMSIAVFKKIADYSKMTMNDLLESINDYKNREGTADER